MNTPEKLPITATHSRSARFQLGLTQAQVIEASGLQGYKLKQFETGRFTPDAAFLEALRDFYQEQGIDLSQSAEPPDSTQPAGKHPTPGASMIRPATRMAFYVREDMSDAELMRVFERMDANDSRIEAILADRLDRSPLGGYSEETDARSRELFGAMAENYLLFRLLQGRNIVAPYVEDAPETHAGLLSTFFAGSPLVDLANPPGSLPLRDGDEEEGSDE